MFQVLFFLGMAIIPIGYWGQAKLNDIHNRKRPLYSSGLTRK